MCIIARVAKATAEKKRKEPLSGAKLVLPNLMESPYVYRMKRVSTEERTRHLDDESLAAAMATNAILDQAGYRGKVRMFWARQHQQLVVRPKIRPYTYEHQETKGSKLLPNPWKRIVML